MHSMHKIAKVLAVMLSVLIVSTSVSVSACDLSCWLNQTSSDCHSAGPGGDDMAASSAMEMSAGMEMGSHAAQSRTPLYGRANDVTRHLMSAPMRMMPRAPQVISKTEGSASTTFAHSRALSACSHETCSQAAASSSPPRTSQGGTPGLNAGMIRISTPANLLRNSNRIASGAPPLISDAADFLSPLRI